MPACYLRCSISLEYSRFLSFISFSYWIRWSSLYRRASYSLLIFSSMARLVYCSCSFLLSASNLLLSSTVSQLSRTGGRRAFCSSSSMPASFFCLSIVARRCSSVFRRWFFSRSRDWKCILSTNLMCMVRNVHDTTQALTNSRLQTLALMLNTRQPVAMTITC